MQTQPATYALQKKEPPNAQNSQILLPITDEGLGARGKLAQVPRLDLAVAPAAAAPAAQAAVAAAATPAAQEARP